MGLRRPLLSRCAGVSLSVLAHRPECSICHTISLSNEGAPDRKIEAEEHWMRYGVTARRKRNIRRVAQLEGLRQRRREAGRPAGQAVMNAADLRCLLPMRH